MRGIDAGMGRRCKGNEPEDLPGDAFAFPALSGKKARIGLGPKAQTEAREEKPELRGSRFQDIVQLQINDASKEAKKNVAAGVEKREFPRAFFRSRHNKL